ncbi:methyltransferase [Nocardia sp. CNY236]|uniref:methyltransferase n=1 Tax=Nocardia sp. CNY236 TaxID=1169152 RepID=UPI0004257056|nr:methyltransferase [Nocardia sp. CNY236]
MADSRADSTRAYWTFVEFGHEADSIRRMAGLATPMALRVAVTLGLPDRLVGDGARVDELAAELDVASVALDLLLGHLETLGIVERISTGYRTTAFGANLCTDADNGLTDLLHLDAAGGRAELAFVELVHSVTSGEAAYPRRYGQNFWADLETYSHLRESFDRQMTRRLREEIPQIVAGFEWSRFSTIVDVGGGQGSVLAGILAAHPTIHGHVVDLEPTAEAARRTFGVHGLDGRTQVTSSSFFDTLPAGADAYLLVDVLHDWDDEHAHRILSRCVEAVAPAGCVLVVEPVGGIRAHSEFNLAMLVTFGGRERRIDEFRALASPHGLTLEAVIDLTDQRCLLEFRISADRGAFVS